MARDKRLNPNQSTQESLSLTYIADHDLIIWMERESVDSEPFFVAYVERGDFADHQVELDEIN